MTGEELYKIARRIGSRLFELRCAGHIISTEGIGPGLFRYRLLREAVQPKPLPTYTPRPRPAQPSLFAEWGR